MDEVQAIFFPDGFVPHSNNCLAFSTEEIDYFHQKLEAVEDNVYEVVNIDQGLEVLSPSVVGQLHDFNFAVINDDQYLRDHCNDIKDLVVFNEDESKKWDILKDYNQDQQRRVETERFILIQVIDDVSERCLLVELIASLIDGLCHNIDQLSFCHILFFHGLIEAGLLDAI